MAFNWRKFPWTNLHDLNLDWIIQTVKTLENNLADAVSTFREMIDTAVGTVRTALATETENRKSGDAAIQTAIENEIKPALATETEQRKSGDAALQSTIDNVIMPILNARKVHDFHVTGTDDQNGRLETVTFKDGYPKSDLDNLIAQNAEIRLVVETPGATQYFNICRPWENNYIGFSGLIQLASGVASQVIGYNGTNFTVYGNKTT